jgi:hypothetical protein
MLRPEFSVLELKAAQNKWATKEAKQKERQRRIKRMQILWLKGRQQYWFRRFYASRSAHMEVIAAAAGRLET